MPNDWTEIAKKVARKLHLLPTGPTKTHIEEGRTILERDVAISFLPIAEALADAHDAGFRAGLKTCAKIADDYALRAMGAQYPSQEASIAAANLAQTFRSISPPKGETE